MLWLNIPIRVLELILIYQGDAGGSERFGFTSAFPFERSSPVLKRLTMVPWGVKSRVAKEKLVSCCPRGFQLRASAVWSPRSRFISRKSSLCAQICLGCEAERPVSYQTNFSLIALSLVCGARLGSVSALGLEG